MSSDVSAAPEPTAITNVSHNRVEEIRVPHIIGIPTIHSREASRSSIHGASRRAHRSTSSTSLNPFATTSGSANLNPPPPSSAFQSPSAEHQIHIQAVGARQDGAQESLSIPWLGLEALTFLTTVLFNVSLLVGGCLRASYVSLIYLLLFLISVALPSHYAYYREHVPGFLSVKTTGAQRTTLIPRTVNALHVLSKWMQLTPRFSVILVTLLVSGAFMVTQIVFQIMYSTVFKPGSWAVTLLADFGITK